MSAQNKKNLKIVQWNCLCMTVARVELLKIFLKHENPDIMAINEVKLNDVTGNFRLRFDNYITLYKSRANSSRGGGVCFLIKDYLDFIQLDLLKNLNLELITIKLKIDKNEILFVNYYNPPNTCISKDAFRKVEDYGLPYVIFGDLKQKQKQLNVKQPIRVVKF